MLHPSFSVLFFLSSVAFETVPVIARCIPVCFCVLRVCVCTCMRVCVCVCVRACVCECVSERVSECVWHAPPHAQRLHLLSPSITPSLFLAGRQEIVSRGSASQDGALPVYHHYTTALRDSLGGTRETTQPGRSSGHYLHSCPLQSPIPAPGPAGVKRSTGVNGNSGGITRQH